ncbi:sortase [uncultured Lactobacillus sp.]|uniref:sortase n=1 Tax=uncultured Lactobacillus sp. TaxID=153152 RepID=UPI0026665F73|nr:sortase [uncultured Lactobacillus sp.]
MKKKGAGKMAVGAVMILLAGLLLAHNLVEDHAAGSSAQAVVQTLKEQRPQENEQDQSTIEVQGTAYCGYLSFPKLQQTLPVASKWHFSQLEISPATYTGSAADRDWVVAGHNFVNHFGRLNQLQVGDKVYFKAASGRRYVYRVAKLEVLKPTAISKMVKSKYDLSLFTCTYSGLTRFTVRCRLLQIK